MFKLLMPLALLLIPTLVLAQPNKTRRYRATCLVADTGKSIALGHKVVDLGADDTAKVFENGEFSYSVTMVGDYMITLNRQRGGVAYSTADVWLGSEIPPQIDLVGNAGKPITMSCVTQ